MPSENEIKESLKSVIDAEVGINIVDLGLVYGIDAGPEGIRVTMTMTTASCPLGEYLTMQVKDVLRKSFPGIKSVNVEIVWQPPWTPAMMSDAARAKLGG